MIVVSDTSPVLNLARIGRLDLLERLYGHVLMPSAVRQEFRLAAPGLGAPIDIDALPWLIVADASDRRRVNELRANLDSGEAEAIVLAIERKADLLLIDEKLGRRIASAEGLTVTGLLSSRPPPTCCNASWPSIRRTAILRDIRIVTAPWVSASAGVWHDDQPLDRFTPGLEAGWFAPPLTTLVARAQPALMATPRARHTVGYSRRSREATM